MKVGEVTLLHGATCVSLQSLIWSPHLSCKRDQIKMKDYMGRQVTPPRRVTSPTSEVPQLHAPSH